MIRFFVPGLAVPGGSKKAFPIRGRDGKTHVTVADVSGRRGVEWRAAIWHAAHAAHEGAPLLGALCLHLAFRVPRPQSHRRPGGGLRRYAPTYPTTRPDVLKLARAVEDALTAIVWLDDSQITEELLIKEYTDETPGVWVSVFPLTDRPYRQAALALAGQPA